MSSPATAATEVETTALARVEHAETGDSLAQQQFMPAMTIEMAIERHRAITSFVREVMKENIDFGKIPGAGDKPTLLKPGAEKLCTLFGLSKRFIVAEKIEDWSGEAHGSEPFFYYNYRSQLFRGDLLVAEADGSCNSHESKYRYRNASRKCPSCGAAAIIKGKAEYGGGWVCFKKKDGCGANFKDGDQAIEGQQAGKVANPDVADQVNTIQKMAQKRALVAATLLAVNASDFFTQDVEDMSLHHTESARDVTPPEARPAQQQQKAKRQQSGNGGTTTVSGLHRRINALREQITGEGAETESVLNERLGTFGCERVEELDKAQALEYGAWLKAVHEEFIAKAIIDVAGEAEEDTF